jgi:hypothetical protein
MAVCDKIKWKMTLVKTKDSTKQTFTFRIETISGTEISGYVYDENDTTKLSDLKGTCGPTDAGDPATTMSFDFSLPRGGSRIGVYLAGFGGIPFGAPKALFKGTFRAFEPDPSTPPGTGAAQGLALDPGDTGTGTGMQT